MHLEIARAVEHVGGCLGRSGRRCEIAAALEERHDKAGESDGEVGSILIGVEVVRRTCRYALCLPLV